MNSVMNMLSLKDQALIKYLNLNLKRSNSKLDDNEETSMRTYISLDSRAKELEDMYQKVLKKEETVENYNNLYEKIKEELTIAVNEATERSKKIEQTSPVDKKKKLVEYLNLEAKRSAEALTQTEKNRIVQLVNEIEEVKILEEAHNKLNNKEIELSVLKDIREKYKTDIANTVIQNGLNKDEFKVEDRDLYKEGEDVKFSDETQLLIDYFKLELKRKREGISTKEETSIIRMSTQSPKVMALEETHKRLEKGTLPVKVLKLLREKYKKAVVEEITKKNLNPSDYLEDDSIIYNEEGGKAKETPKPVINNVVEKKVEEPVKPVETAPIKEALANNDELAKLQEENKNLKARIEELEKELSSRENGELPIKFVELQRYLELDKKRQDNVMTMEERKELRNLTKSNTNDMVDELEDIERMKANGEYDYNEYKKIKEETTTKYNELLNSELEKCKTN